MTTTQTARNGDDSAVAHVLSQAAGLTEAGRPDEALAVLALAVDQHGDIAELHAARGWAFENTVPPRWADALAAYRTALALDPRQLWAALGQATALERLGEVTAAAAVYAEAAVQAAARAEAEPEFLELLGWCEYRLGRLDAAAATFRRALAIDPAWVAVHLDLGLVHLLRGEADADAHYDAALAELQRRDPQQRVGALQVAIDDLDEAMATAPAPAAAPACEPRAATLRTRLAGALAAAR